MLSKNLEAPANL